MGAGACYASGGTGSASYGTLKQGLRGLSRFATIHATRHAGAPPQPRGEPGIAVYYATPDTGRRP